MRRTLRLGAAITAAAVIGAIGFAGAASAHVTVNPGEAVQGGFTKVAFRVPNERDAASTTKVEVFLPTDAPVAFVSTQPVPGWTVTTKRAKLATPLTVHDSPVTEVVSQITWTAGPGAEIKAGQFQEFPVSLGPLPAVDKMVFKALQTYSNGEIVRWIDVPAADGQEVEHPAPVLTLKPAAAPAVVDLADTEDTGAGGNAAVGLAVAALIAGLGGLALGGLAVVRTRRSTGFCLGLRGRVSSVPPTTGLTPIGPAWVG
jgi:periplasmic copper chaperone A